MSLLLVPSELVSSLFPSSQRAGLHFPRQYYCNALRWYPYELPGCFSGYYSSAPRRAYIFFATSVFTLIAVALFCSLPMLMTYAVFTAAQCVYTFSKCLVSLYSNISWSRSPKNPARQKKLFNLQSSGQAL